MVSACYYEPLRIQKRWQNYKLKHLVSDKTLNLFPLREKELKWCRQEIQENKVESDNTDNKVYYLDVVDHICASAVIVTFPSTVMVAS